VGLVRHNRAGVRAPILSFRWPGGASVRPAFETRFAATRGPTPHRRDRHSVDRR